MDTDQLEKDGIVYILKNQNKLGLFSNGFHSTMKRKDLDQKTRNVLFGIVDHASKMLDKVSSIETFMPVLRRIFDIQIQAAKEQSGIKISCKKGCSFCCSQRVCVGIEEVKDVLDVPVDEEKLKLQASWSEKDWSKNLKNSSCVFLSDQGECKIYDKRPLVCRTVMSTVEPKLCDDENALVQFFVDLKSEAFLTAYYNKSKYSESLPKVLIKARAEKIVL